MTIRTKVKAIYPKLTVLCALSLTFLLLYNTSLYGINGNINLVFNNYTIEDGLQTNNIVDIVQDTTGFLWLATENGLSRFDGENFKNYYFNPDDSNSLSSNFIHELHLSRSGDLFIGTRHGLNKYNPVHDNFTRYVPNPLLDIGSALNIVVSIAESTEGVIHFLSEGGILYSLENNIILNQLSLNHETCKYLLIDEQDNCWITYQNIIYKFNLVSNLTERFVVKYPDNVQNIEVTGLIRLDSTLLISAYNSDLIEFNFYTGEQKAHGIVSELNHTTSLMKEKEMLYIGTSVGLKILNMNTGTIQSFVNSPSDIKSISSNSITATFKDDQSNLWIGTKLGLNVAYRNKGFYSYNIGDEKLKKDLVITAILEDQEGLLWLGYSQGIYVLDKNLKPVKPYQNNFTLLPSNDMSEVFCFLQDQDENVWIGTYVNGLLKYNRKEKSLVQYFPGKENYDIAGADIRVLKMDNNGNIWIAIHGIGLYVLEKDSSTIKPATQLHPKLPHEVNQKWAFDLAFDQHNNLWIASSLGTYFYNFSTNAFYRFNQSHASKYFFLDNFSSNILIDAQNNIWIGGINGINVLSDDFEIFKTITIDDGLPNNEIAALNQDHQNNIWVSTKSGISKIIHDGDLNFKIINYNVNHGLNTNDFTPHSTFFTSDSIMYFGGTSGFTWFYPHKTLIDSIPPNVVLTNLWIFDKRVAVHPFKNKNRADEFYLDKSIQFKDNIRIKEKFSMIGFEFASLNYVDASKNAYQYKLEGSDDEWRDLGTRNIAYFNNLNPGDYIFKVKGANNFDTWSTHPAEIAFTIVPPLWRSKAAIIFYFFLIVLFSFYLINLSVQKEKLRLKIDQQHKLKEMQTRFFMNVSHELKTPLTLISIPLKRIMKQFEENKFIPSIDEVDMINRNVNRLIRIMNQLFDFRKIELNKIDFNASKADVVMIIRNVIAFFDYQLKQKSIKVHTSFSANSIEFYFDTDKVDKIFYNLISNALKHSEEQGELDISVKTYTTNRFNNSEKEYLQWTIRDNGKGIPERKINSVFDRFSYDNTKEIDNKGGTGIGLSLVKEFVRMHKGEILIESKAREDGFSNSYTAVTVNLPMDKSIYNKEQISEQTEIKISSDYNSDWAKAITRSVENKNLEEELIPEYRANTVLIIDDEKDICTLIEKELSPVYKVYKAYDGVMGMELALRHLPTVIISDIMMPDMDGYELCKKLKSKVETSHIPVVLLTGKTGDEDEMEAYATGADAFIPKPFEVSKLLNRIESLISNRIKLKRAFLSSYGIELKDVVPSSTDEKFIQSLLKIIHENISDHKLNFDVITNQMAISRSILYKKLNSIANTSVNLFIRKVRLQKATELLSEGSKNITEVAYAVGFDSLPYFSKCFQEEFGMSPSKYAENHRLKV